MSSQSEKSGLQVDQWVWGREKIVWGYHPSHQYTFKVIEPLRGRQGCMSLQYHNYKSETWLVVRGVAWGLIVVDGTVCTRLMRPGDVQNLPTGCIHRMMGVTDDTQVVEPSTPDAHAADKSVAKDVVRLHCVLGREVVKPRSAEEAGIVERCIAVTEEAIASLERGALPVEHSPERLRSYGASNINL